MSDPEDINTKALQENIRRTVAVAGLRKIRILVDEYEAEEAFKRRFSRKLLAILGITAAIVFALLMFLSMLGPEQRGLRELDVEHNTRDPDVLRYVESWSQRVANFGDTDPSISRVQAAYGACVVKAVVRADGTLEHLQIFRFSLDQRASCSPELAAAVTAMVRGAAPFPLFPEVLNRKADVLHITRQFAYSPKEPVPRDAQSVPSSNRSMQPTAKGGG